MTRPLVPTCRVCGCTDDRACVGGCQPGCSWVEDDLCSACTDWRPLTDDEPTDAELVALESIAMKAIDLDAGQSTASYRDVDHRTIVFVTFAELAPGIDAGYIFRAGASQAVVVKRGRS